VQQLRWELPTEGPFAEPSAAAVLREINGADAEGHPLASFTELQADGSTACGCWIYCGVYAGDENRAARRTPHWEQDRVPLEWAWSWPSNRRILYNRASADPAGRPWSERKRYVWWDEEQRRWTGHDVPDFEEGKPPDYLPPEGATAEDAIRGDRPFVLQVDGNGWLYAPTGLVDGPLPTHYEPHESPFENRLYGQRSNPINPSQSEVFPFVFTSYRLTEHHTAGAMSRTLPFLAELQPEPFCEVSPRLARERGLEHGGWATIVTARTAIEARVLVTDRLRSLRLGDRWVEQVGLPYHWGAQGLVTGDSGGS